jgi:hypothetical protein
MVGDKGTHCPYILLQVNTTLSNPSSRVCWMILSTISIGSCMNIMVVVKGDVLVELVAEY